MSDGGKGSKHLEKVMKAIRKRYPDDTRLGFFLATKRIRMFKFEIPAPQLIWTKCYNSQYWSR